MDDSTISQTETQPLQEEAVKTEEVQTKDSQQTTTSPSTSSTALPPDPTTPWTESQRDEHIKEQAKIKEERLQDIIERIKTSGTIKPKDVSAMFSVTLQTARKYLKEIKQKGVIFFTK